MRRLSSLLVVMSLAFVTPAHAEPNPVGVIVSSGATKNNLTTTGTTMAGAPFTLTGPGTFYVRCDAAAYVATGSTSSTVANTYDVLVPQNTLYKITTKKLGFVVAVLPVSGAINCPVYKDI